MTMEVLSHFLLKAILGEFGRKSPEIDEKQLAFNQNPSFIRERGSTELFSFALYKLSVSMEKLFWRKLFLIPGVFRCVTKTEPKDFRLPKNLHDKRK